MNLLDQFTNHTTWLIQELDCLDCSCSHWFKWSGPSESTVNNSLNSQLWLKMSQEQGFLWAQQGSFFSHLLFANIKYQQPKLTFNNMFDILIVYKKAPLRLHRLSEARKVSRRRGNSSRTKPSTPTISSSVQPCVDGLPPPEWQRCSSVWSSLNQSAPLWLIKVSK